MRQALNYVIQNKSITKSIIVYGYTMNVVFFF